MLLEQDDEAEGKGLTRQNFKAEIMKFLQEQGIDSQLESLQREVLSAKQEHADALLAAASSQIKALKALATATDLDTLEAAVESAKSLGAEVEPVAEQVRALRDELAKKREALPQDKKFLASIKKSAKLRLE